MIELLVMGTAAAVFAALFAWLTGLISLTGEYQEHARTTWFWLTWIMLLALWMTWNMRYLSRR